MLVTWAHWGRYHAESYADSNYGWKSNLDEWTRIYEGRVVPFQYYSDHFAEPWVAAPYASAIKGDREYLIDHDAYGICNLLYPPGYWWNSGLNNYLCGIAFYDASADPFDLLRDFAMNYYGPDAGPLLVRYYEEWAKNVDLAYHVRGDATKNDRATLDGQRKRYLEPALKAVANDSVRLYRVTKIERLHALAEELVETHCAIQEIGRLRTEGDFQGARTLLPQAQQRVDSTAAFIQSLIDLNQGLVDPELINFFYPRIRTALAEEAKALEKGSVEKKEEKKELSAEDMVPRRE
jgi:hypothetical protein